MTHLRAILAIVRKDALDIMLDKAKLGGLLTPIALTLLYVLVGNVLSSHPPTLLVYNPGQSGLQQLVSSAFTSPQITQANSASDVGAAFGANGTHKHVPYYVGLVIPADFEQSLRSGGHPQVSLYIDGSVISEQQGILLQAVITNYARTVVVQAPPASVTMTTINPQPPQTNSSFSLSKYYSLIVLPFSLIVGITLMPALLIEEKEKKTLRMLMVSPASFGDMILGKLLVALGYQLAVSLFVLAVMGGFAGNVPLLLLYVLLGACFSLVTGLLLGSILQTAGSAGAIEFIPIFAFIVPAIFIPLVQNLSGNPIQQIIKFFPTYYFAHGVYDAMQSQGSFGVNLLDVGITSGCIAAIFLLTLWILRRQSAVAATI
jgi:ABC-2 type transport system permease protein